MRKADIHSHIKPTLNLAPHIGTNRITCKTRFLDNTLLFQIVARERVPATVSGATGHTDIIFLRETVLINQILPIGHTDFRCIAVLIRVNARIQKIFRCRIVLTLRLVGIAIRPLSRIRQRSVCFSMILITILYLLIPV